jgi:hypothetical protein
VVAEQQLQRMLARIKGYFSLSAAVAKVHLLRILGDWQPEVRQARIDQ